MPFQAAPPVAAAEIASGTSFPTPAEKGDCFYRTDLNEFYVYDGTDWVRWEIETHEAEHESGGADELPIVNQPQPSDDEKIYFGTDDDYSLRYDSADDTYYIRDEVNATEVEIPKNVAMNIATHAGRHEVGGADELFDQNLNTTDNVQFAQVSVADLVMDNDWRFTEHPDHGVVLKSPEGRIFKLIVEELT